MAIAFISDLHLSGDRPDIQRRFESFLERVAFNLSRLYILGDLFEYWIGDDASKTLGHDRIESRLVELTDAGVFVVVMHGNRDFLLGQEFCRRTGCRLLANMTVIEVFGQRILLTHGDQLCTDDIDHQAFRAQVLQSQWQRAFLARPIAERKAVAHQVRYRSEQGKQVKSEAIMDVNLDAVLQAMDEHDVRFMIHGHTHRPGLHHFMIDEKPAARMVLGDWFEQDSILLATHSGLTLQPTGQRLDWTEISS